MLMAAAKWTRLLDENPGKTFPIKSNWHAAQNREPHHFASFAFWVVPAIYLGIILFTTGCDQSGEKTARKSPYANESNERQSPYFEGQTSASNESTIGPLITDFPVSESSAVGQRAEEAAGQAEILAPAFDPIPSLLKESLTFRMEAIGKGLFPALQKYGFSWEELSGEDLLNSRLFFGGAIAIPVAGSSGILTAYYNPFVDGAIVVAWKQAEGVRLQIGEIGFFSGISVQENRLFTEGDMPMYLKYPNRGEGRRFPLHLKQDTQKFVAGFNRKFGSENRTTLALRHNIKAYYYLTDAIGTLRENLAALSSDPISQPSRLIASVGASIQTNSPPIDELLPASSSLKSDHLSQFPPKMRAGFRPSFAFSGRNAAVAIFSHIEYPTHVFCLETSTSDQGITKITDMGLLEFSQL